MSKKKNTRGGDGWVAVAELRKEQGLEVDGAPGWFTVREYAERFRVQLRHAYNQLESLVAQGLMERRLARRVVDEHGRTRVLKVYRVAEK